MNYIGSFQKWNKEKIIKIIKDNGFRFTDEYAGIFQFYINENKFENSYILYLQKTGMYLCNPNIRIASCKSYKGLNDILNKERNKRK